jgi:putative peptidoglycan lipid II flippase
VKIRKNLAHVARSVFVRDTLSLTGIAVLGKSIGLLVPFFIALWFGAGRTTDSFFFAYGLILFFTSLLTATISTMIVPAIVEIRNDKSEVGGFIGSLFVWNTIGFLVISCISLFLLKPLLTLITRFPVNEQTSVVVFSAEMLPLILFLIYSSILDGACSAYKKYNIPGFIPVVRSIVTVVVIFMFKDGMSIHAVAAGYCIGEAVRLGLLILYVRSLKLFSVHLSFRVNSRWKSFVLLSMFQVIALVLMAVNPIIDRSIASWLGEGAISVLYYADRLYVILQVLVSGGIATVLLSHLSYTYNQKSIDIFMKNVYQAALGVCIVSIALGLLAAIFAEFIVRLALDRGAFDKNLLDPVRIAFLYYIVGFVFSMLSNVLIKAHLVLKNMNSILICAVIVFVCNILFDVLLSKIMGTGGIALATSIANIISAIYLLITFRMSTAKMSSIKSKSI